MQGGKRRLREDSTLNHFTASCGQSVFRGDRLPADMVGDLFVCEPVGRLVRRADVLNTKGKITLKNVYNKAEFLASTDMNFRPTGPDGCLYVVDMYRGIIQQATWTGPGSYIRPVILRKGLDKNIGRGRIYRIVHKDYKPAKPVKLLELPTSKLLAYLSHPNGWVRDNAQKLIIIRNDKSVVPALQKVALESSSHLGRIHAMWTLEGLGVINKDLLTKSFSDRDPNVRKTAIWISENFFRSGDSEIITALEGLRNDSSADVKLQLALSLRYSKTERAKSILKEIKNHNADSEMIVQASSKSLEILNPPQAIIAKSNNFTEADKALLLKGAANFNSFCTACLYYHFTICIMIFNFF